MTCLSLGATGKGTDREMINLALKEDQFGSKNKVSLTKLIESAKGLSYYSIQKTLINAIKRSLFAIKTVKALKPKIDTPILVRSA
ncbi:hypothetical protein [Sphingobacterium faecium]|uniref:hypothetical protein n=1 Tax=Sphingobacterium faecium TaxID=34087 RepID=UPI001D1750D7|nr:hypothetical protein [Sphingobacterium faecium]